MCFRFFGRVKCKLKAHLAEPEMLGIRGVAAHFRA